MRAAMRRRMFTNYNPLFATMVALEAIKEGARTSDIARHFGICPAQVWTWKRQLAQRTNRWSRRAGQRWCF